MKPLAVVGVLSYSLYIWQQLFLLTVHTWEAFVVALFLLPAVASASYFWIERPFIRRGAALAARYRSSKTPIPVSSSV